jgi:hypothetical protein
VNFRVTRHTALTLFRADGTSLADTQAHLRHASAATTAKHYGKPIPEGVKKAVNDFADSIMALKPSKRNRGSESSANIQPANMRGKGPKNSGCGLFLIQFSLNGTIIQPITCKVSEIFGSEGL